MVRLLSRGYDVMNCTFTSRAFPTRDHVVLIVLRVIVFVKASGIWNEQRGVKEERQNHSKSGNEFNVENEFNKHRKCVITDTWIVSFGIGSES